MATASFYRLQVIEACDALLAANKQLLEGSDNDFTILRAFADAAVGEVVLTSAEFSRLARYWPKRRGLTVTDATLEEI